MVSKKSKGLVLLAMLLILTGNVVAASTTPIEIIRITTESVLSILSDKAIDVTARRTKVRKTVEDKFDFEEMSRRTLSTHWNRIANNEKREFVPLFKELLENVYLSKLEQYADVRVKYQKETIEGNYASVFTIANTVSADVEIPIIYKLLLKDTKSWKIYDVQIEGISLVNNYRSQFNQILGTGNKPFSQLLDMLRKKNMEFSKDSVSTSSTYKFTGSK
ncbi:MAG: ABC transporter substrate-binding protein [Candidatus Magnetoovum sp. WYHC-5]|nr:ABC transporter substrate-binding protein [Candidatus Magnetoovum sp. WYHC-5]